MIKSLNEIVFGENKRDVEHWSSIVPLESNLAWDEYQILKIFCRQRRLHIPEHFIRGTCYPGNISAFLEEREEDSVYVYTHKNGFSVHEFHEMQLRGTAREALEQLNIWLHNGLWRISALWFTTHSQFEINTEESTEKPAFTVGVVVCFRRVELKDIVRGDV